MSLVIGLHIGAQSVKLVAHIALTHAVAAHGRALWLIAQADDSTITRCCIP